MIPIVPMRTALGLAAILSVACMATLVRAEDSSPWQRDAHSALRLLAGSRSGAVLLGGVAIQLQPGWHTYWRAPGGFRVPPRFDFSQTGNVENVAGLYSAPPKIDDGAGGTPPGFTHQKLVPPRGTGGPALVNTQKLVLPVRTRAKDPKKPVPLRADINYAVCEKICIPVDAKAELAFASVASTKDGNLSGALNSVPNPANIGDPN